MEFFADKDAGQQTCDTLARTAPENPMCTWGYLQAMRELGNECIVTGIRDQGKIVGGAILQLRRGRLNVSAELDAAALAMAGLDDLRRAAKTRSASENRLTWR